MTILSTTPGVSTGRSSRIAVIICSVGRPQTVAELVPHLLAQTRPADRVLFVVTKPRDLEGDPAAAFAGTTTQAEVVIAEKGLTRQRNAGLDRVHDCGIVVFYDDDFVPSRFALAGIEAAFALWPLVNGMTGRLIADGINGVGFSDAEAAELVAQDDDRPRTPPAILRSGLEGLYGCNMAYRMAAVGETRFDPELPLYGWQEDIDFAARLAGGGSRPMPFPGSIAAPSPAGKLPGSDLATARWRIPSTFGAKGRCRRASR